MSSPFFAGPVAPPLARAPPAQPAGQPAPGAAHETSSLSFLDLLSSFNPLQYIPVVGPLYRAITGDRGNEGLRDAGSLAIGGAMGGPIGVAVSFGTMLVEKISGFGPDWLGERAMAELGLAADAPPPVAAVASAPLVAEAARAPPAAAPPPPVAAVPLTPAQLAAYGVRRGSDGSLRMGNLEGADVLNAIELTRHDTAMAVAAYGTRASADSSGG
jgi:hypothetical protein